MDNLHAVLRAIRPEVKAAPDHLSVFREFLAHLGQLQQAPSPERAPKPPRRRGPKRTA